MKQLYEIIDTINSCALTTYQVNDYVLRRYPRKWVGAIRTNTVDGGVAHTKSLKCGADLVDKPRYSTQLSDQ